MLAKTKQELLTRRMLPKVEPMQTSKRKLMPVLSLLFHTQTIFCFSLPLKPGHKG